MPERDKFTWNTMIFAYSCSGRLADAKQLFLRNPIKNTISWSALISGYCKYGSEEEAFVMVMESQGQESCREYISGTEICQAKQCDDQCTVEYNGYGKCLAGTVCLCTFICKT
ncbi:hypothetical protein Bca4012_099998 [Brassica carinata]